MFKCIGYGPFCRELVHCGAHFVKLAAKDNFDAAVFIQSALVKIKKVDQLFAVALKLCDKFVDYSAAASLPHTMDSPTMDTRSTRIEAMDIEFDRKDMN